MSEHKHTPGPWKPKFGEAIHIKAPDDSSLAVITHLIRTGRRDGNEVKANARLIAAAPELLAALQEVIDKNTFVDNPDWWGRVFDVVKKAGGRTP